LQRLAVTKEPESGSLNPTNLEKPGGVYDFDKGEGEKNWPKPKHLLYAIKMRGAANAKHRRTETPIIWGNFFAVEISESSSIYRTW